MLLEEAEHAPELLPELAQRGVVGDHHQPVLEVREAEGLLQAVRDQRPRRVGRADLILGHPLDEGVAIFGGEGGLRILVDGAHAELAPVRGLEAQGLRLFAPALLGRLEAAREGAEVEDFDLDRAWPRGGGSSVPGGCGGGRTALYLGLAAMRTVFRPDVSWLLASAGTRRRIKAAATRAEVRIGELTSLLPSDYGRGPLWAVLGCFDERRRTAHSQPSSRTASSTRRAPTSCSTPTTRWTGIPGARRRSRGRGAEDKPILLSIGYSACHWCHVMERESFEDEEIAAPHERALRAASRWTARSGPTSTTSTWRPRWR